MKILLQALNLYNLDSLTKTAALSFMPANLNEIDDTPIQQMAAIQRKFRIKDKKITFTQKVQWYSYGRVKEIKGIERKRN